MGKCEKCNGTGMADSGGVQPWGEQILIECDCAIKGGDMESKSREQFEYEAGKALCLPTSIIELARKGDGYDHAFDSMNIMQPLNGWWAWWKKSRAVLVVELPQRLSPARSGMGYTLIPNDNGDAYHCDDILIKLRAAGITVKGEGDE